MTLGVSIGDVAGHLGRLHVLSRRAVPDTAAMAVNGEGVVAVAWTEATKGIDGRVRLAVRRAGGLFTPTVTIASGAVGRPTGGTASGRGVAVAVDGRGEVVAAYQRGRGRTRTIEARLLRRRLGRSQTLGPQRGLVDLSAAMAPNGRAVVAWGSQDVGEEANEPHSVYAAVRPAGASRFSAAQVLDAGGPAIRPEGTVALAVAGDGSAIVAWSSPQGRYPEGIQHIVRVATAGPRGRFATPRELAPSGAGVDGRPRSPHGARRTARRGQRGSAGVPARSLVCERRGGMSGLRCGEWRLVHGIRDEGAIRPQRALWADLPRCPWARGAANAGGGAASAAANCAADARAR
jgi:hypothetical protein